MPQVSAAVLRSTPSSTSASASIRRAAALSFSPLAALRSSEAVRSSRVIDTAAPIDAAPLKGQHRVRVSLIWESLMSHSFGPLVLEVELKNIILVAFRFLSFYTARVISAVLTLCQPLRVYSEERTSSEQSGWSVSCQSETSARNSNALDRIALIFK